MTSRMIEQGDRAPDFELPDQDGSAVKMSDFKGTRVVVYFYPKADTPGTFGNRRPDVASNGRVAA
jgi:peroxiredoxin